MSNIILTGATGFVGGEVLPQLLENAQVERVTCLSRRPVLMAHEKLTTLLCADFSRLDVETVQHLKDHDACIWALGAKAADVSDLNALRQVTHDFTLAFADSIAGAVERAFCLCYLSGMGADPTESARLPWEKHTRHLKGRTEKDLQTLSAQHSHFSAISFRPGGILPRGTAPWSKGLLAPIAIGVEQLARAMIRVALKPSLASTQTLSNAQIRQISTIDGLEN
jgi:nucleoside-diphosphate-sugar epimerase